MERMEQEMKKKCRLCFICACMNYSVIGFCFCVMQCFVYFVRYTLYALYFFFFLYEEFRRHFLPLCLSPSVLGSSQSILVAQRTRLQLLQIHKKKKRTGKKAEAIEYRPWCRANIVSHVSQSLSHFKGNVNCRIYVIFGVVSENQQPVTFVLS